MTYDTFIMNANNAYQINSDVSTRNATTSANKKAAFGELKHFLGPFIDYLEVNTKVPDTALEFMGLRPRHQPVHKPLPRPTDQPVVSVRRLHDELTVYVAQPERDQPTKGVAASPSFPQAKIIPEPGNNKGVWVVGNARSAGTFSTSAWCGNIKVTSPFLMSTSCGHDDPGKSCVINTDNTVYVNAAFMNSWPQCTSPWRDPTGADLSALSACAPYFPNPKLGHVIQPSSTCYEVGKYTEFLYLYNGKAEWPRFIRCDSNSCWEINANDYHWLPQYRCIYTPN
jgi:hypothetical protein